MLPKSLYPTEAEITAGMNSGRGIRQFCFSHWNIEVKPEEIYPDWSYIAYQEEICPKTGQHHYQGYMQITSGKVKGYSQMARANPSKCWFRPCGGTDEENHVYCTKSETAVPDTFVQFGVRRGFKGLKLEFSRAQAKLDILAGTFDRFQSPAHTIFYSEYIRVSLENLSIEKRILDEGRTYDKTRFFILFGVKGAGKTQDAMYGIFDDNGEKIGENLDMDFYIIPDYYKSDGAPIFSDYKGQRRIIIDEADKRLVFSTDFLCQATSNQVFSVPTVRVGAGKATRAWTEIIITMNGDPMSVLQGDNVECLSRRITGAKYYPVRHPKCVNCEKSLDDMFNEATSRGLKQYSANISPKASLPLTLGKPKSATGATGATGEPAIATDED